MQESSGLKMQQNPLYLPSDGRESCEFAASVRVADLSGYGLVLNADETNHIRVGSQRFDVTELLGQRVLHTDSELGLSDIPLGMDLYFLGNTDSRDRFNSVDSVRPEYFGGSIVMPEPIDLGIVKCHFALGAGTENFTRAD